MQIMDLAQLIHLYTNSEVMSSFAHQYIRVYGDFVSKCFISKTQPVVEQDCLSFIHQVQKKVKVAVSESKDFEAYAFQLRGARTLAKEFAECTEKNSLNELCTLVAKPLPDIITRAVFSVNYSDAKKSILSVEESLKDILEVCSRSSQESQASTYM
eukprot:TRINITY_DN24352_c0_g1_i1.p1 TRINITY_DN24352_c0_g1~~TRINITY_DN24352_c0_g1_i1.p1  ORF type:complete len:156 (-),score=27.02 TRINITY_DN24352_c0_g1_i1:72-539(-)